MYLSKLLIKIPKKAQNDRKMAKNYQKTLNYYLTILENFIILDTYLIRKVA